MPNTLICVDFTDDLAISCFVACRILKQRFMQTERWITNEMKWNGIAVEDASEYEPRPIFDVAAQFSWIELLH